MTSSWQMYFSSITVLKNIFPCGVCIWWALMRIWASAVRKLNKAFTSTFNWCHQKTFSMQTILYLMRRRTKDGHPAGVSDDIYLIINHSHHFHSNSKERDYLLRFCNLDCLSQWAEERPQLWRTTNGRRPQRSLLLCETGCCSRPAVAPGRRRALRCSL